jgi:hypothetical protein
MGVLYLIPAEFIFTTFLFSGFVLEFNP